MYLDSWERQSFIQPTSNVFFWNASVNTCHVPSHLTPQEEGCSGLGGLPIGHSPHLKGSCGVSRGSRRVATDLKVFLGQRKWVRNSYLINKLPKTRKQAKRQIYIRGWRFILILKNTQELIGVSLSVLGGGCLSSLEGCLTLVSYWVSLV